MVERLLELGVSFVKVDFTNREDEKWRELERTESDNLPTNLIYPPNYPTEPAIKLDSLFGPADVHKVLDRMEQVIAAQKAADGN